LRNLASGGYNFRMNTRSQQLLREALTLPANERADVAVELIASLDKADTDLAAVEQEWANEIERRAKRSLASDSMGTPWEDVRRRAEAQLRKQ
jgi:putative addiction module component (TIGR02574 family)